ncbi:MAG: hypothetical protein QM662_18040 [Gordonia sp. (in: high G+C Gram-positive bacteria)]
MGTRRATNRCSLPYVRVTTVEASIIDYYKTLRMPRDQADTIRELVRAEIDAQQADATEQARRTARNLDKVQRERAKLLEAHYAGAVPLDLLKTEMTRLTKAKIDAEKLVTAAQETVAELKQRLDNALALVEHCHSLYSHANAKHRRMLNQGFFRKIYIGEDGQVQSSVVHEPFAGLLAADANTHVEHDTATAPRADQPADTPRTAFDLDGVGPGEALLRAEAHPQARVLPRQQQTRRVLAYAPGSNNNHLAEDRGFEPHRNRRSAPLFAGRVAPAYRACDQRMRDDGEPMWYPGYHIGRGPEMTTRPPLLRQRGPRRGPRVGVWRGTEGARLSDREPAPPYHPLTAGEADALAEITGGSLLVPGVGAVLIGEVLDAIDIAGEDGPSSYAAHHGIDTDRLVAKLRGIGPSADLALRCAFARWWALPPERRDTDGYRAVGLRIVVDTATILAAIDDGRRERGDALTRHLSD